MLDVLRPIWTDEARDGEPGAPAHRGGAGLRRRRSGQRAGENPARWRGHLDHLLPKPRKVRAVEHHAALDWREAPAFMAELAGREGIAAKALAFAILTAARSGEVRGMTWARGRPRGGGLDRAGRPHQGRQGAPGAADRRGAGAARRAGRARRAGVPEPDEGRPCRCPT